MSTLKSLREENDLTQEFLANLIGVSLPNYCKKENGTIKISLKEARIIAKFFNKTIEEIFFDNDVSKIDTQ